MAASPLPDDDHVSRYCKPSAVGRDGLPLANAFELRPACKQRPAEDHLSVNWLEYFQQARDLEAALTRCALH